MNPALRFLSTHHWAIEDAIFARLVAVLERHAMGDKLDAAAITAAIGRDPAAEPTSEPQMVIDNGTAIIPMRGVMARYADSINGFCQSKGRSSESIQSDMLLAASQGAQRIILQMDTPGGEVAGTSETGRLVAELVANGIEVIAFVDGMCASAGYWIASQCSEIVASAPTNIVGSIGISTTLVERVADETKQKIHVINSADAKGAGPLNDARLANTRAIVMDLAKSFAEAVASGRGFDAKTLAKVTTAEVFTAAQGLSLGLVDRIASFADVLSGPQQQQHARGVSSPAFRAAHGDTLRSPSTAAKTSKGTLMKSIEEMNALIQKHPGHAKLIGEMAVASNTAEQIEAAIKSADIAAVHAKTSADLSAAQVALATAQKTAHDAATAQAAAEKERDELKATNASLTALIAGGKPGNKIHGDGADPVAKRKIKVSESGGMTAKDYADITAGTAEMIDG